MTQLTLTQDQWDHVDDHYKSPGTDQLMLAWDHDLGDLELVHVTLPATLDHELDCATY